MAGEWMTASIQEISEKVAMGPFGSSIKVETFVSQGVPVISGQHLRGARLEDGEYNFISLEHADKLANANVRRGDVIFTHAGNIGQVAYIPESSKHDRYVISQRQFYMRPDLNKVLPEFITYYFTSSEGQHKLLANTSSSGVPSIAQPVTYLRTIKIPLPPLPEQRAIAHILGTLDDKIELNRRKNETLEAIARALFKSWFVDFDPVRANAKGCGIGLPKHIADLFPDSFEDSELGEIPKGWRAVPLPEAIEVNPTRSLRKGDIAPYLDMANMPTRGHSPDEVIDRPFGSGMRFVNGDTLVARITPCLENGKTAYVDFLEEDQIGWGSTEYIVLRPTPPLPEVYAYCLARSDGFREFAIQSMTGSSGRQRVPAESLSHFHVILPSRKVAEQFGKFIQPNFARASSVAQEVRTLTALRNTLLPKLISGELRIEHAERLINDSGRGIRNG